MRNQEGAWMGRLQSFLAQEKEWQVEAKRRDERCRGCSRLTPPTPWPPWLEPATVAGAVATECGSPLASWYSPASPPQSGRRVSLMRISGCLTIKPCLGRILSVLPPSLRRPAEAGLDSQAPRDSHQRYSSPTLGGGGRRVPGGQGASPPGSDGTSDRRSV